MRKGPIRKDGSVVLSPKPSPAPSLVSNNSDKENFSQRDEVFISKEVEQINSEVSTTSTLPRAVKKVSFQSDPVQEIFQDDRNSSRDSIGGAEQFLDEAVSLMNLNKIESNTKSSVVGTQVSRDKLIC